jgi:hypothetical protein
MDIISREKFGEDMKSLNNSLNILENENIELTEIDIYNSYIDYKKIMKKIKKNNGRCLLN